MRSPPLAELAPISWEELWSLIRDVPGRARWAGTTPRRAHAHQTTGALLSLCFPFWAAEITGARLGRSRLKRLVAAQAHVLTLVQAHDAYIDREEQSGAEVLPLSALAHRRLSELIPDPRDPFWAAWQRLTLDQAESARWEVTFRRERFGLPFVSKLGRKGALLRWPAFAVARGAAAARADALLAKLLSVLQMIDDLLDYESDRAKGQPNALVAAAGGAQGVDLHLRAPAAANRVRRAIHEQLAGMTGALAEHLRERGDRVAALVADHAMWRAATQTLELLRS